MANYTVLQNQAFGPFMLVSGDKVFVAGGGISGIISPANTSIDVQAFSTGSYEVINDGGLETIEFNGTESFATVNSGGTQNVFGTTLITRVAAGGTQTVNGTASVTTVTGAHAQQRVFGKALDCVVDTGGTQLLYAGGVATRTQVGSGGTILLDGGQSVNATIGNGGRMNSDVAGTATGTVVNTGGVAIIRMGSKSVGTTVNSGGLEALSDGGSSSGIMVKGGGRQTVTGASTAAGTTIASGGIQDLTDAGGTATIKNAGIATGTIIQSGGVQNVSANSVAAGTMISSGGTEIVAAQGQSLNAYVQSGGTLVVQTGASVTGTTFAAGGALDLRSIAHSASDTATISASNVLTITAGAQTFTEQLGSAVAAFSLVDDGNGGTIATALGAAATVFHTIPVYRFFDSVYGTHFSTADAGEKDTILKTRPDLVFEGTGGLNAIDPNSVSIDPSATPVYRFFDTKFGTHFFTASQQERDGLLTSRPDLTPEGIGFYEDATQRAGDIPVYRFFDNVHGTHFYTGDSAEYKSITTAGSGAFRSDLTYEGVGFYAPSGT